MRTPLRTRVLPPQNAWIQQDRALRPRQGAHEAAVIASYAKTNLRGGAEGGLIPFVGTIA